MTRVEKKKKTIIIGAGPGGLASAMRLASKGFDVTVYEKQKYIGGRTSRVRLGEYSFDRGPTFFMMPETIEELFREAGKDLHDYLDVREVDPLYTLKFKDGEISPTRDRERMVSLIEAFSPGEGENYLRFMERETVKFGKVSKLLRKPFQSLGGYVSRDMLAALPNLDASRTVYGKLSDYFADERLKWAFSFQAKYLGMSAWKCPGTFTILSYLEHQFGLFHPIGGVNGLCEAMAAVTKEFGGKIHTGMGAEKVLVEKGAATGVLLEDGTKVYADDVIINADFSHAALNLFDQRDLKKYKKERIEKKKQSCSTFMLYLGVSRKLSLPHHMILFADDYRKNVEEMTKGMVLSADASIYVHNPSAIDPTLAPEGKSSLYVLMPVPNLEAGIDWEQEKGKVREQMLARLEKEAGLEGIRTWIEEEKIITPLDWQNDMYVYKGATFSMAHSLDQMMYLRPHNAFEDVKHVFLTGGGTHPGSGLPTIFESARISTELLEAQYTRSKRPFLFRKQEEEGEIPV